MNKTIKTVLAIAALSISSFAAAATTGWYATANIGMSKINETFSATINGIPAATLKTRKSGLAGNLSLGYQINQYLAVEAGYTRYANLKTTVTVASLASTDTVKVKLQSVDVAVKAIYPINPQLDVFGKTGLARMNARGSETLAGTTHSLGKTNKTVALFGLGTDYNINQNVALTVQAVATAKNGSMPSTYLGTAGVTYRF